MTGVTESRLKVGLLVGGLVAAKPPTGLQRYLSGLLGRLARLSEEAGIELYLYVGRWGLKPKVEAHPLLGKLRGVRFRYVPFSRGWWRFTMGALMAMDRLDVFHFPDPHMARFCPVPAVVTFHDLMPLELPGDVTRHERRYLDDMIDAARRAAALIAVSETTRESLERHLSIPPESITVTLEGVDRSKYRPVSGPEIRRVREAYGLPERFVLTVGTLHARKNHLRLIRAFLSMIERTGLPHHLVMVGRAGSATEEILAYLRDYDRGGRVMWQGYLPDEDLPALYSAADALALVSLGEGFGLPLLEAMACGVPVLCSNVSSLAEVAGGAAYPVDPRDETAIAYGLEAILTDLTLRARLIADGLRRAAMFTWERTARKTLDVYRAVAASGRGPDR